MAGLSTLWHMNWIKKMVSDDGDWLGADVTQMNDLSLLQHFTDDTKQLAAFQHYQQQKRIPMTVRQIENMRWYLSVYLKSKLHKGLARNMLPEDKDGHRSVRQRVAEVNDPKMQWADLCLTQKTLIAMHLWAKSTVPNKRIVPVLDDWMRVKHKLQGTTDEVLDDPVQTERVLQTVRACRAQIHHDHLQENRLRGMISQLHLVRKPDQALDVVMGLFDIEFKFKDAMDFVDAFYTDLQTARRLYLNMALRLSCVTPGQDECRFYAQTNEIVKIIHSLHDGMVPQWTVIDRARFLREAVHRSPALTKEEIDGLGDPVAQWKIEHQEIFGQLWKVVDNENRVPDQIYQRRGLWQDELAATLHNWNLDYEAEGSFAFYSADVFSTQVRATTDQSDSRPYKWSGRVDHEYMTAADACLDDTVYESSCEAFGTLDCGDNQPEMTMFAPGTMYGNPEDEGMTPHSMYDTYRLAVQYMNSVEWTTPLDEPEPTPAELALDQLTEAFMEGSCPC